MARRRHELVAIIAALGSLVALVVVDGVACAAESTTYGETMSRARNAAEQGRWRAAAEILDAIADQHRDDYRFNLDLGWYRLRSRQFDAAEVAYRRALAVSNSAFDARLGLADALIGREAWSEALDATEPLVARAPQDAAILDRHALALFWVGRNEEARSFYLQALQRAPDDLDAVLGLGWCAQRSGDRERARQRFRQVLARDPDNSSAREGLALAARFQRLTPQLYFLYDSPSGHPWRDDQTGVAFGLDLETRDRWQFGGTARVLSVDGLAGANAGGTNLEINQAELFISAGRRWERGSLLGHAAILREEGSSRAAGTANLDATMIGISGSRRFWAELQAALTRTFYDDGDVTQANLGVVMPLRLSLSLFVGAETQWTADDTRVSGATELRYRRGGWFVALGGSYGRRERPVDLLARSVFNRFDLLDHSFGVRAEIALGRRLSLFTSLDFESLLTPLGDGSQVRSDSSRFTVGWTFPLRSQRR